LQRLVVGIGSYEINSRDAKLDHAVDRIATTSPKSYDFKNGQMGWIHVRFKIFTH
jgi:hypothetical protein